MPRSDDYDRRVKLAFDARDAADTDYLIEALRDPDLRGIAAKWLAELGEKRAIDPLILLLSAQEQNARASAADALGKLHAISALPNLIDLAEHDNVPVVREWAIGAIAGFDNPEVNTVLVRLLNDPDPRLRRWVVTMLGRRCVVEALEPIRLACRAERFTQRRPYWRAIRAIKRTSRKATS